MIYKFLTLKYINFALGFFRGILFAFIMGPEGFAVWSFINLVYTYSMYSNFGLDFSMSLLMAKNEESNDKKEAIIIQSTRVLMFLLIVPLFVLPVLWLTIATFEKYITDSVLLLFVVIITIQGLVIKQLYVIARNEKKINHVAVSQMIVVLFTMLSALQFNDEIIFSALIFWCIGELVVLLYLYSVILKGRLNISISDIFPVTKLMEDKTLLSEIIKYSLILFSTNIAFSLIALLARSLASNILSVKEFGIYSFAFSIVYAVYMVIGNIIWAKYPYMIRTYSSLDNLRVHYKDHLLLVILLSSAVLIAGTIFSFFIFEYFDQYEGGLLYCYWFVGSYIVLSETLIDRMIIQSSGKEILLIIPSAVAVLAMILLFLLNEGFYHGAGSAKALFIGFVVYSAATKLIIMQKFRVERIKMFVLYRLSFLILSLSAVYLGAQFSQSYLYVYFALLVLVVWVRKNMILEFMKVH